MTARPLASPRHAGAALVALLAGSALLLASPALAIKCSSESINCGGGVSLSPTFKLHDTLAENRTGTVEHHNSVKLHEGFWFTLPYAYFQNMAGVSAVISASGAPVVHWTAAPTGSATGFNVYRATAEDGPFALLNDAPLPPQSSGSYEDTTTWPQTTYWYDVRALHFDGSESSVLATAIVVRTGGEFQLKLFPLCPNPMSGSATVLFDVPDEAADVHLAIYSVTGQLVATILDGPTERGRHEKTWDGHDNLGHPVSSGIYFARLVSRGKHDDQKIMILR